MVLTMDGVTVGTGNSTSGCFLELTKLCRLSKFQLALGKVDLKLKHFASTAVDAKCMLNRSAMPFVSSIMQSPSLKQLTDCVFFLPPVKDLIVFYIDLELFLLASKASLKYSHLALQMTLTALFLSTLFFSHQKNLKSLQLWDSYLWDAVDLKWVWTSKELVEAVSHNSYIRENASQALS